MFAIDDKNINNVPLMNRKYCYHHCISSWG